MCAVVGRVVELVRVGPWGIGRSRRARRLSDISDELRLFYESRRAEDEAAVDYVHCRIALVAAMMIELETDLPCAEPILREAVKDAWSHCDDVVGRSHASDDPVFQPLEKSLLGLESEWQDRDWRLMGGRPDDLPGVYASRLAALREPRRYTRRTEIAHRVAELAGWDV